MTFRVAALAPLVFAATTAAQATPEPSVLDRVIRVSLRDVAATEALATVARLAGARLSYSPEQLSTTRRVTLNHRAISLGAALAELLAADGLEVAGTQRDLIIIAKTRTAPPRTIRGRVRDRDTGLPVAGAVVAAGGRSAATDAAGEFRLVDVTYDVRDVGARRIGYVPARASIDSTGTATIALAVAPVAVDRVIVIGSESQTVQRASPSAVTVVNRSDLERGAWSSLDDVLRAFAPGIAPWDDGPGSPSTRIGSIRGASSFNVNYLKTYVDGVEVAAPFLSLLIDPSMLERVEIIRGPQGSALYGSNANSGVLQVVTRRTAAGRPRVSASVENGRMSSRFATDAVNVRELAAHASGGGRNAALAFNLTKTSSGPYAPRSRVDASSAGATAQLAFGPVAIDASAHSATKDGGLAANPIVRQMRPNVKHAPGDSTQGVSNSTVALTARVTPARWATLRLVGGRDRTRLRVGAEPFPWMSPADSFLLAARGSSQRTSSRASVELGSPWSGIIAPSLTLGVDRSRLEHGQLPWLPASAAEAAPRARDIVETSTGTFAQASVAVANTLFLTGGLRAERNDAFGPAYGAARLPLFGAALVADFGAVTLKLRSATGRGIRAPLPGAADSLPLSAEFVQRANPNLAPEAQRGTEWGVDAYVSRYARVHYTVFRQRAEDLIQQVLLATTTKPRPVQRQNVGTIANDGWELEAGGGAGPFSLAATYARVDSRVRKLAPRYTGILRVGDRTFEVPAWTSSVTASVGGRLGSLSLTASGAGDWVNYDWLGIYRLAFQQPPPAQKPPLRDFMMTYPGYTMWRAAATARVAERGEIYARADNLTNVQNAARDNIHVNTGRVVMLGVRARY